MGNFVIGVDIGGTNIRVGLVNEHLELVRKESALTRDFQNADEIFKTVKEMTAKVDHEQLASKIGIALPIPWNDQTQFIRDITNVPCLENVSIETIRAFFPNYEVFFENDVNVITVLESDHGAAKPYNQSIYITVSSGIGCGIILDKKIIQGAHGYAGEIGSMIISDSKRNHSTLYNGTLESLCSGIALEAESKFLYGIDATSGLLFERYHIGDRQAIEVIDRWVEYFSNAIVSLMQIIDPNIFVIGGAVIHHNQWLIDSVIESAKKKVLPHLKENINIVLTEFGPDAGIIGAGYNVYKKEKRSLKTMKKLKVALIGAGSVSFGLGALQDLVLSERLRNQVELEIALMDIVEENVNRTYKYATEMFTAFSHPAKIWQTTNLEDALKDADFSIVAIEVERYHYWSQDFHIPRRYGSKQLYGENGGPGSMFHTLRNLGPMLEIAKTMEKVCPDAWLINYTNPEAKLVEAISKLTSIKVVGLCHGLDMGIHQLAEFLEIDSKDIAVEGGGLNHFGFFTKIWNKSTGEDLYPLFHDKEKQANRLAHFDHIGLSRTLYHTYGYYPYPGTNHCGEYISWAEDFYAGLPLQFRYNPMSEQLWKKDSRTPEFVYCASGSTLDKGLFENTLNQEQWSEQAYLFDKDKVQISNEYAIPIIEAIFFDDEIELNAVNMPNHGAIKGLPEDMVVETQAIVNKKGIVFKPMTVELPTAIIGMIHIQGTIHKLLLEAFLEESRTKLLQAILLDPQAPTYYQACAMIDEMCVLQKEILPKLEWK